MAGLKLFTGPMRSAILTNMQIVGKLHAKFDTDQVNERFRKREFVLEYVENPLYPQLVLFQLIQDNCSRIDGYEVGIEMEVHFNIKGRPWTSPSGEVRYFNSLEAWKIIPVAPQESPASPDTSSVPPPQSPPPVSQGQTDPNLDDLPF